MTRPRKSLRPDKEAWSYVLKHDKSIRRYASLLFNALRRQGGDRSVTLDDAVQQARMAAFRAAQLFETERGLSFMTLAAYWIHARMRTLFRHRGYTGAGKRVVEEERLDDRLTVGSDGVDGRGELPKWLMNILGDKLWEPGRTVERLVDREKVEQVQRAFARLPARQRHVLHERFVEERTLDDIGHDLGVCRERVRQLEKAGLDQLRAELVPDFCPSRRSARMATCERTSSSTFANV
ncbi:MAG: sigma-70 family RNA polymerase sigma factor [Veillonellaceae bacterium]|nr:sigma-70 family RNA polymerase sigma factor [Veillonellaceae bacterium]